MRRLRYLLALLGLCTTTNVDADCYFREKGTTFLAGGACFYRTATFWSEHGHKEPFNDKFEKDIFFIYAEHDVTQRDTIVGELIVIDVCDTHSGASAGVEEVHIGWQRALYQTEDKNHEASVRLLSVIPGGGIVHPYSRLGRWGGELDLRYQGKYSWGWMPLITATYVGYRWYADYPSDQLRFALRQGADVLPWLQLQLLAESEYGLADGSRKTIHGRPVLSQWRFLRLSGLARIRLHSSLSLVSGYYKNVWGENYFGGGGWCATLWSEF